MRGPHSTGAAFIEKGTYRVDVVKDTVLPHKLYRDPRWAPLTSRKNICIIGHNRFATMGKQVKENAHPFHHGDIVLAHNGTLTGQHRLPDHEKFDVDSENIAHSINTIGVEETWKNTDGAATVVFWDQTDRTLNFLSNLQRPFFYSWISGGHAIAWCSDIDFLKGALNRNGLVTSTKQDQFTLAKDKLTTFKMGRKGGISFYQTDLEPFRFQIGTSSSAKGFIYRGGKWYNKDTGEEVPESSVPSTAWTRGEHQFPMGFGKDDPLEGLDAAMEEAAKHRTGFIDTSLPVVVDTTTSSTGTEEKKSGKTTTRKTSNFKCTKAEFDKNYDRCCFCELKHVLDYDTATILDRKTAACEDCAREADINNIKMRA